MLLVSEEVALALREGRGVVALESTIITHGMPYPQNLETALLVEATVREHGAVPATIALMDGKAKVGLTYDELERLARAGQKAQKVSRRDLAVVLACGDVGSTTVAATMLLANLAGIRVFATGGVGGVHRGDAWDISADIAELARTPVLVVCAGAKSVLDLPRTVELLETAGVNVIGYKTNEFPAFFTPCSGLETSSRADSPTEVAKILHAGFFLMGGKFDFGPTNPPTSPLGGSLLVCPIPAQFAADAALIEAATETALCEAREQGILGKKITPFLLDRICELTGGASLAANIQLVRNNAAIASQVACELAKLV